MDLRIQRTKKHIEEAFLSLRAEKPLEKITVKELADRAFINKATFYTHYKDIYDLQEQLENKAVIDAINDMPHPEYLLTNSKEGTRELTTVILSRRKVFDAIFKNGRDIYLADKIDKHVKEFIYKSHPQLKGNVKVNALLTVMTYGCYSAYIKTENTDVNDILDVIGDVNERLSSLLKEYIDK